MVKPWANYWLHQYRKMVSFRVIWLSITDSCLYNSTKKEVISITGDYYYYFFALGSSDPEG